MKYFWAFLFTVFEMIGMATTIFIVFAALTGDLRMCFNNRCFVDIDRPSRVE
jgi:hypothetical protein